jgi:hypothetical protein
MSPENEDVPEFRAYVGEGKWKAVCSLSLIALLMLTRETAPFTVESRRISVPKIERREQSGPIPYRTLSRSSKQNRQVAVRRRRYVWKDKTWYICVHNKLIFPLVYGREGESDDWS